jgi:hypothetical protein
VKFRKLGIFVLAAFVGFVAATITPANADTLWYNGDFNRVNGYGHYIDGSNQNCIYDDFTLTSSAQINTVWSNNLLGGAFGTDHSITAAQWSIRSGMSTSNQGTVIASGTSAATETYTGNMVSWAYTPTYSEYH